MRRYWITFSNPIDNVPTPAFGLGVGVTAQDYESALKIVKAQIFDGKSLPSIEACVEDVDVSTLDSKHVLTNMGVPSLSGIWFPLGFKQPAL